MSDLPHVALAALAIVSAVVLTITGHLGSDAAAGIITGVLGAAGGHAAGKSSRDGM